jgi:FkbM family methyltransferase
MKTAVSQPAENLAVLPDADTDAFSKALLRELVHSAYREVPAGADPLADTRLQDGVSRRLRRWLREALIRRITATPMVFWDPSETARAEENIGRLPLGMYGPVYHHWADAASRDWFVKLIAYRILGRRRVLLPSNTPAYWQAAASTRRLRGAPAAGTPPGRGWSLFEFDLGAAGYPVRMVAHDLNVLCTFLLEQYAVRRPEGVVAVEPGDVVLDAGGCWGDTALYAAVKAGPQGRVICFEFSPDNLALLERNLSANPELAGRIEIVREAVWDGSKEFLVFDPQGPETHVSGGQESTAARVRACSIDRLVEAKNLARVDFVKMDIEGAELAALRGAIKTLRRFRPKLAIALYHRDADFHEIPNFVKSLDLGYRLFLDHFTVGMAETVLFARADGGGLR